MIMWTILFSLKNYDQYQQIFKNLKIKITIKVENYYRLVSDRSMLKWHNTHASLTFKKLHINVLNVYILSLLANFIYLNILPLIFS